MVIPLALFLLPYAPKFLRPWLMGIALGRKPHRAEPRPPKPTTRVWVAKGYEEEQRAFLKSFDEQVAALDQATPDNQDAPLSPSEASVPQANP